MRLLRSLLLVLLLGAPALALAVPTCSLSVVGVAFGAYDVFDPTALDSSGTITLNCSGFTSTDTLTVDLGCGGSASCDSRQLAGPSTPLGYNLYLDASRTQLWGDGFGTTMHYGPVTPTNGADLIVPVYGRIFARQNVPAGSYADTVVVTVNF